MLRAVTAGVIGAVSGVMAAFLIVGVACAVGGIEEPFNTLVYGWNGARLGMLFFVLFAVVKVWPVPAIALAGAALGVIVRLALQQRATRTHS